MFASSKQESWNTAKCPGKGATYGQCTLLLIWEQRDPDAGLLLQDGHEKISLMAGEAKAPLEQG